MNDEEKRADYFQNKIRNVPEGFKISSNSHEQLSWWAKEWIDLVETLESGNRFSHGRKFAKAGQVNYVKISKGIIEAKVQDARLKPYRVRIELNQISDDKWIIILNRLAHQSLFVAKLLAKELPHEVIQIFQEADSKLLPSIKDDLKAACTCPDWANPCKHTAAVFYILAEKFNENPFLYFQLRGKSKEEIIEILKENRLSMFSIKDDLSGENNANPEAKVITENDYYLINKNVDDFWDNSNDVEISNSKIKRDIELALIKKLDESPFEFNGENMYNLLYNGYKTASKIASKKL